MSRRDLLLALLLTAAAQVELWVAPGLDPELAGNRAAVAALAAAGIVLALRVRRPLVPPLALAAAVGVQNVAVAPTLLTGQIAALLAAAYSVAAHAPLRPAVLALASQVTAVATLALAAGDSPLSIPVFLGAPWVAGRAVRRDRERARRLHALTQELERERERTARLAVVEERTRIAREVHDVLAHGLGVVSLQAAGARRVLPDDAARAGDALEAIEDAARGSASELRRLLDLLRAEDDGRDDEPLPGLERVGELVQRSRAAGQRVELALMGAPRALAPGLDLAGYRIVQEALTNAGRHAPGARTRVVLRYEPEAVEIEVVDDGDGRGAAAAPLPGSGAGLIGIRERVALYGGAVEAGPAGPRGFRVWARLPEARP